jgi:hypothetical protein
VRTAGGLRPAPLEHAVELSVAPEAGLHGCRERRRAAPVAIEAQEVLESDSLQGGFGTLTGKPLYDPGELDQ